MNLSDRYNDTTVFLKWDKTEEGKIPFVIQILREPEEKEFRGKPKFDFPVQVSGIPGEKTLSCSQSALNALIDAANEAGVQDQIDQVAWKCWKTGDGYDTEYHWELTDEFAPF